MEKCVACGMPMEKPEDHALGDVTKNYCRHCVKENGEMQSFEEKRANLIDFVTRTQGLDHKAAVGVVETMMKELPAWRDQLWNN